MTIETTFGEFGNNTYTVPVVHDDYRGEHIKFSLGQFPGDDYPNPLVPPPYFITISTDNFALFEAIQKKLGNITFHEHLKDVGLSTAEDDEDKIEKPYSILLQMKSSRVGLGQAEELLGMVLNRLKTSAIITNDDASEILNTHGQSIPPQIILESKSNNIEKGRDRA